MLPRMLDVTSVVRHFKGAACRNLQFTFTEVGTHTTRAAASSCCSRGMKGYRVTQWQKILAILAFAAAARHVFVAPANQPLQPPNVVTHVVQRPEFPPVDQEAELYPAELYSVAISVPAGKAVLLTSLSEKGSRQPVVLTWRERDQQSEFDSHSLTDYDLPPGWSAPVLRDLPRAARRTADAVANPQWEHIQDA